MSRSLNGHFTLLNEWRIIGHMFINIAIVTDIISNPVCDVLMHDFRFSMETSHIISRNEWMYLCQ